MKNTPNPFDVRRFRRALLRWYDHNKRDLPWRVDRDPYHVWVAEIMLQQTRVAAVIEYYKRFMRRFPTVATLGRARQASVLTAWSGLGYYRRARALHAAARLLQRDHAGRFPTTASELCRLPGIGRYTAAAIASISFNQPCAVVDGNVERVLIRISGRLGSPRRLWAEAEALLSPRRPGDFNQAMMELGATVCLPRAPQCVACPVRSFCMTRGEHPAGIAPTRKKKKIAYALVRRQNRLLLVQRPRDASLMPGMWELPAALGRDRPVLTLRHAITQTDYEVRVLLSSPQEPTGGRWMTPAQLARLPLTGVTRKILRRLSIIQ